MSEGKLCLARQAGDRPTNSCLIHPVLTSSGAQWCHLHAPSRLESTLWPVPLPLASEIARSFSKCSAISVCHLWRWNAVKSLYTIVFGKKSALRYLLAERIPILTITGDEFDVGCSQTKAILSAEPEVLLSRNYFIIRATSSSLSFLSGNWRFQRC